MALTFGITTSRDMLAGTIDVQLHPPCAAPEPATLAFGLYPAWRGQGLAQTRHLPSSAASN